MNPSPLQRNHFNRAKPFYPIVAHYVAQLIGAKELLLRGLIGSPSFDALLDQFIVNKSASEPSLRLEDVRENLRLLSGPLWLKTEQDDDNIEIDIDYFARDFVDNRHYLLAFLMRSAGHVLVRAHETCKDKPYHTQEPLWEFLRHCRNAAGHGGHFNLFHGEPKRPARWGKFEILPSLQGTPLFKTADGAGLLAPGDPLRLLWDIEQAYPDMA